MFSNIWKIKKSNVNKKHKQGMYTYRYILKLELLYTLRKTLYARYHSTMNMHIQAVAKYNKLNLCASSCLNNTALVSD